LRSGNGGRKEGNEREKTDLDTKKKISVSLFDSLTAANNKDLGSHLFVKTWLFLEEI
jgi:hypothetical protein